MNPFAPAEGWIDLGNFNEAAEVLHNLQPTLKSSVEFCRLWIRIYMKTGAWTNVELMCETLLEHSPEDEFGIRSQAEAFHRQGRSREAFAALQFAPLEFKRGGDYFYAMARYLTAIGQQDMALRCLGQAFDEDPSLRMKALDDPELEKVWLDLQEG